MNTNYNHHVSNAFIVFRTWCFIACCGLLHVGGRLDIFSNVFENMSPYDDLFSNTFEKMSLRPLIIYFWEGPIYFWEGPVYFWNGPIYFWEGPVYFWEGPLYFW
jgi:hypothetical protein